MYNYATNATLLTGCLYIHEGEARVSAHRKKKNI